jgi:hypothetical protein
MSFNGGCGCLDTADSFTATGAAVTGTAAFDLAANALAVAEVANEAALSVVPASAFEAAVATVALVASDDVGATETFDTAETFCEDESILMAFISINKGGY